MKRFIIALTILALCLTLTACGKTEAPAEPAEPAAPAAESALDVLEQIWSHYAEEEKFASMGGDMDHLAENAPGEYSVESAEALDGAFGIPADYAAAVDQGASLMHMMNLNTFTGGAFHLADAAQKDEFAAALKESVLQRQWLCGFPDTLVIFAVDDYIVSAFGAAEIMETFKTRTLETFSGAELLYEESLS